MSDIQYLHQEILKIKQRNKKVEADKAWETSYVRRFAIALLTYIIVCLFFITIGVPNPFLNAFVPVLGFLLSTMTIHVLKQWWIQNYSSRS